MRNLTYLEPFSPILLFAHKEVSCRFREGGQRAVEWPSLPSVITGDNEGYQPFLMEGSGHICANVSVPHYTMGYNTLPGTAQKTIGQRDVYLEAEQHNLLRVSSFRVATRPSRSELLTEMARTGTPSPCSSGSVHISPSMRPIPERSSTRLRTHPFVYGSIVSPSKTTVGQITHLV